MDNIGKDFKKECKMKLAISLFEAGYSPVFYDWEFLTPSRDRDVVRYDVAKFLENDKVEYLFEDRKCAIKGKVIGHDDEKVFYTSYLHSIQKLWIDRVFAPTKILLCIETKSGHLAYCLKDHMKENMKIALKNATKSEHKKQRKK